MTTTEHPVRQLLWCALNALKTAQENHNITSETGLRHYLLEWLSGASRHPEFRSLPGEIMALKFVTNTTLLSEKVVIYYEKRGNAENYIKEAKYDMAVGHLLLKSFWANEAVFQMMMLSYNLFLLFKFDSLDSSEYRQQIKTFRLKYVFLAAKIIKTARYVIMKLSENYPYKGVYEKCLV
ncbi:TPA: transposase [Escherichia coli]